MGRSDNILASGNGAMSPSRIFTGDTAVKGELEPQLLAAP
jgi:hypothetical protein